MLSFKLSEKFINNFKDVKPDWGYTDAAGSSVGEIVFLRTYSRKKEDGTKERWWEVCERVINGMYSIQKDHAKLHRLPWSDAKAQASAKEAFTRLFELKWTPPGRGLWVLGTPLVHEQRNSAPLQNCAAVSTADMNHNNPGEPFAFLMEASMLGVGVGFDLKGADKGFKVYEPGEESHYTISDTREAWAQSVGSLVNSYLKPDRERIVFDYSEIRPAGSPIKTFGGLASGPGPLKQLHDQIRKVLNARIGEDLTGMDILDIMNLIGVCVVSGNVRRSAELAVGDAHDQEFINAKNADMYPVRNSYDPENPGWGWMSNNSVFANAGDDLSHLADHIARNGEPGIIWLDTSQAYGRLGDPPNWKDHRVALFNPCLSRDTWVQTAEGARQINDLIGQQFIAIVDGKPFNSTKEGFFKTGHKELYTLKTDEGWSAQVTLNHELYRPDGSRVEAQNLQPGDKIRLSDHRDITPWKGRGSDIEGYSMGWLVGDGYFTGGRAYLQTQGKEATQFARKEMENYVLSLPHRSDFRGWSGPYNGQFRMNPKALTQVAESWGIRQGSKAPSDEVERASYAFYQGFLRGLFDTDGHVEYAPNAGVSVRLASIDRGTLEAVQRMLSRMGIRSSIRGLHEERDMTCPNTGNTYRSQKSYRLLITNLANVQKFMDVVGFWHTEKEAKALDGIGKYTKPGYKMKFEATFQSLEYVRTDDVFDCTVPGPLDFCGNGLYMRDCAEQSLESYEMCTLVESYPHRHTDLEDYLRTLKFAYLYAKTVTLLPTHWEKTNAIMARNRRIGTSASGISDFVDNRGWAELRSWMDQGYDLIQKYDEIYSEWLCVRQSIKTTTVKPSGTVSILAGVSPGVHWSPGGKFFLRRIRFRKEDPMVELLRLAGYTVEPASEDPENTVVVGFPIKSDASRSEREVTIFEKAHLASEMQRYWSDNSVSVTLSFDPETEGHHIGSILSMFDGKLKTVSFLPQGNTTYPQMPYSTITEEEYEAGANVFPVDLQPIYDNLGLDAIGEAYCTTDSCEVKEITNREES